MFDFASVQAERSYPEWLTADLRTDHACEVAAVAMCRGAMAAARRPDMHAVIRAHFRTERRHMALMVAVLDPAAQSRLLPVWRFFGRTLGFVSSLIGPGCYHRTTDAMESVVDRLYARQITRLSELDAYHNLRRMLEVCRLDELRHRNEAAEHVGSPAGLLGRAWWRCVVAAAAASATVARRI